MQTEKSNCSQTTNHDVENSIFLASTPGTEDYMRRYPDIDPVWTISLMGECSVREAAKYFQKYGSVRSSLVAIEGKKYFRRFLITIMLGTTFCVGLIFVIYWEIAKVHDAQNTPMTETSIEPVTAYDLMFPIIIVDGWPGTTFDIWMIQEGILNRPPELLFHNNINGLRPATNATTLDAGQYCFTESHWKEEDTYMCSFCGFRMDQGTLCHGNHEDRLVCENGAVSNLTNSEEFDWRFCTINNSSRLKCPSHRPLVTFQKVSNNGIDHGCGWPTAEFYSHLWYLDRHPYTEKNMSLHWGKPCEDGTTFLDRAGKSTCSTIAQNLNLKDSHDPQLLKTPGIYTFCESLCTTILILNVNTRPLQPLDKVIINFHMPGRRGFAVGLLRPDALEGECQGKTWQCIKDIIRYGGFIVAEAIVRNTAWTTLPLKYEIHQSLDGEMELLNQQMSYTSTTDTIIDSFGTLEVIVDQRVNVFKEYAPYQSEDAFQTVASFITYWRIFVYLIFVFFVSRTLPSYCLEFLPRYSEPLFSKSFRQRIQFIVTHENNLVGIPEHMESKMTIRRRVSRDLRKRLSSKSLASDSRACSEDDSSEKSFENLTPLHLYHEGVRPLN